MGPKGGKVFDAKRGKKKKITPKTLVSVVNGTNDNWCSSE